MRTMLLAVATAVLWLSACSPNATPQPMGSSKPEPPKSGAADASPPAPPAKKDEAASTQKYPVSMPDEEWKKKMTPEQFAVCRQKHTEWAWGKGYEETEKQGKGSYACSACGQVLFESATKFHSGTGWPSFYAPSNEKCVDRIRDVSLFPERVEVVCSNCGSHLGHVFTDGPAPTGLRFCINSVSLKFNEAKKE